MLEDEALIELKRHKSAMDKTGYSWTYCTGSDLSDEDRWLYSNGYISVDCNSHEYTVCITNEGWLVLEGLEIIANNGNNILVETTPDIKDGCKVNLDEVIFNTHQVEVIEIMEDRI